MAKCIHIVGIRAHNRAENAPQMQSVLTKYGRVILSRAGVPSPDRETGVITLTCEADVADVEALVADLQGVPGVNAAFLTLECATA